MFFCPNCDNTFTIKKEQTSQSNFDSSTSSTEEDQKKMQEKSRKSMDVKSKIIFKCSNCGYVTNLKPGTMILSRTSEKVVSEFVDQSYYKNMVNDKTLPCTREYICPNDVCISQKNPDKREAVWFKPSRKSYGIKYVCRACQTVW
jgi:hypothetical protein